MACPCFVIASVAKQSRDASTAGLLRRYVPRNDNGGAAGAEKYLFPIKSSLWTRVRVRRKNTHVGASVIIDIDLQ
jgi:hypothetical protein